MGNGVGLAENGVGLAGNRVGLVGNGVGLWRTGSDWRGTGSDWRGTGSDCGERGRIGGERGQTGGERGRTGRERGRTGRERGRTGQERGSDWAGMEVGLASWTGGVGLVGRTGGLDWSIRGGASSFGPTLCLRCAQTAHLYMKRRHAGCTGQGEPFEGRNSRKGIIVLNGIITTFHVIFSYSRKTRTYGHIS